MVGEISAGQLAAHLFIRHVHADMVYRENPEQIVYREQDVINLLTMLGYPLPDWEVGEKIIMNMTKKQSNE